MVWVRIFYLSKSGVRGRVLLPVHPDNEQSYDVRLAGRLSSALVWHSVQMAAPRHRLLRLKEYGISQAPYTIKVPRESVMRACTFGLPATISAMAGSGIRLNAVDKASASVAVGAITLTLL